MPFKRTGPNSKNLQFDVRKTFVGRLNEVEFFIENILKPEHPSYNIISVSGQGGVGKSTLLNKFMEEIIATNFKDYCLTASIDERQNTPTSIMEKFADQLSKQGYSFERFEKELNQYKDALRRLRPIRETYFNEAAKNLAESVPLVGSLLEEGVKRTIEYLIDESQTRQLLKDAQRLENPLSILTEAFVDDLNRLAETQTISGSHHTKHRRRIILFFDTFEQLALEIVPWLLDYFLVSDISDSVVIVIAGRDPIESSIPDDPKRWLPYYDSGIIYSIQLHSFTENEARAYLAARGISDPSRTDTIWKLSHGLPLYLSLLTSNTQGKIGPTKDVVTNFLRWIPEEEKIKRTLVLDAALLSRPFNQDDLSAFTYISEQDRSSLYKWLTTQPFVRSSEQDGRLTYHALAQALFSRYLYQLSPRGYQTTRKALADHYQTLLTKVQKEEGKAVYRSTEWQELILAQASQLFLLPDEISHAHGIEQVLTAHTHIPQRDEIVKLLVVISNEQIDNPATHIARQTARELLQYIEAVWGSQECISPASYLLENFGSVSYFSSEQLARIYYNRGTAYYRQKEYHLAIEDYNHMLTLEPDNAAAYSLRGKAHYNCQEYKEANADYDHALALEPTNATLYILRGDAHYCCKNYQKAITYYTYAINRDAALAMAYAGRGFALLQLNEYEKAVADFNCVTELDPTLATAYAGRFFTYLCYKDTKDALVEIEYALSLEVEERNIHFFKGMVFACKGVNKEAKTALEKAMVSELPPTLLTPLYLLEQKRPDFYEEYLASLLIMCTE